MRGILFRGKRIDSFWVGKSPREFAPDYDEFYYWYELGETVFLSREEAEQFLKERENDE